MMKGSKCKQATNEELNWVKKVQKVLDECPNKRQLWLFSGSGTLYVMKTPEDGNEMTNKVGVNPDNIIGRLDFKNDGGDWD